MSMTLGANNLLEYNSHHRVLICRECRYAIQKSAVGSHLLRHKIYRGERQRLLTSIAQLDLAEPEDVQFPVPSSSEIQGLPVISGYRCLASGCESLCASSKRMRRHWSEVHDENPAFESCAVPVRLQTFFRGTRIRYFEVAALSDTAAVPKQISHNPLTELDLERLRYFHHFTLSTSRILPHENVDTVKYWQEDVVVQALQSPWLMCGLLAIAASHVAALAQDELAGQCHIDKSVQFWQQFSKRWLEMKGDAETIKADTRTASMGAQLMCIRRCQSWTSDTTTIDRGIILQAKPTRWSFFTSTVRGCADPEFALTAETDSDVVLENTSSHVENVVRGNSVGAHSSKVPPALLEQLRTLPSRIAEAVPKPDHALDFFATMSAIEALVESCSISYSSDEAGTAWRGMNLWLSRISMHFEQMVDGQSPAALVVLAHWLVLVERVEKHCWFLQGLAARVLSEVVPKLSKENCAQSLVQGLVDQMDNPQPLSS